jgi:Polyketide cyclase / dehydrase and lipid transport
MTDDAHEQIEVAAPLERCFALATAFEDYPNWTSDVKAVTVLVRDAEDRGTQVEFQIAGLGRKVRYVLEYDYRDAPHAFSWSLVEGDLVRALDGCYAFTPAADGTLVDYTLHVDLVVPMPGIVKRKASGMIMGNALRDLKRAVEHEMTDDEPTIAPPVTETTASHPDAVAFDEAGTEERPLPPPSIVESVITELLGAVPEVRDHVLEAADALLDAAKALIDAADRVVRQQRGEE